MSAVRDAYIDSPVSTYDLITSMGNSGMKTSDISSNCVISSWSFNVSLPLNAAK